MDRKALLDNIVRVGQVIEDNNKRPNRFEILELLGKGGFVGIKSLERLQFEVDIMLELQDLESDHQKHFIKMISRDQAVRFKFAVPELLGLSVFDIRTNENFTKSRSLQICIQTCNALRDFRSDGFLHRDVKAQNYAVGKYKQDIIYIFDFGIAKRYLVVKNGKICRIKKRTNLRFIGTLKYCPIAAHDGIEQAPKNDMEA